MRASTKLHGKKIHGKKIIFNKINYRLSSPIRKREQKRKNENFNNCFAWTNQKKTECFATTRFKIRIFIQIGVLYFISFSFCLLDLNLCHVCSPFALTIVSNHVLFLVSILIISFKLNIIDMYFLNNFYSFFLAMFVFRFFLSLASRGAAFICLFLFIALP